MKNNIAWSALANIQKVSVVKSMYIWLLIVPILAKTLSNIEGVANVTIFEYSFALDLGLPFSWKVFYFAALSFAASNLIYLGKCYSIIKDHRSFSHFKEEGKGEKQLRDYSNEVGFKIFIQPPNTMEIKLESKHLQEPFWEVFEKANMGRPLARYSSGILYVIGFLLMGVILVQNLYVVIKLAL